MRAFLYLNLTEEGQLTSYRQPDMELVKTLFPDVALLDLDAASDEVLVHYAKRMMQEATQIAVCIKVEEQASFRSLMALLEDLLQAKGEQLILLRGENARLQRILEARPQLHFKQVKTATELITELALFFKAS